jgi:hypothetical protein
LIVIFCEKYKLYSSLPCNSSPIISSSLGPFLFTSMKSQFLYIMKKEDSTTCT